MNNRTLEVAALVLIAWALLQFGRDKVRHRVVVTGPGSSHLDWEDAHWDDATEGAEFDGDDVDVDVEIGKPALRMSLAEARRMAREEHLRLRSEIREQLGQARQEAWRNQAQWHEEYGTLRATRNQIREEIKRDIRDNLRRSRDDFREFRDQARQLRNEIRESVRNAVGIRREKKSTVKIEDEDID